MVQASGVDHVVLHCSDVERSKTFYTEILGMSVSREDDRRVFLQAGGQGVRVALFKKEGDAPLTIGNDLNHLAFTSGRIPRVARLAAPLTNGPLLYRARAGGSAECLLWVSFSHSVSHSERLFLPRSSPSEEPIAGPPGYASLGFESFVGRPSRC